MSIKSLQHVRRTTRRRQVWTTRLPPPRRQDATRQADPRPHSPTPDVPPPSPATSPLVPLDMSDLLFLYTVATIPCAGMHPYFSALVGNFVLCTVIDNYLFYTMDYLTSPWVANFKNPSPWMAHRPDCGSAGAIWRLFSFLCRVKILLGQKPPRCSGHAA